MGSRRSTCLLIAMVDPRLDSKRDPSLESYRGWICIWEEIIFRNLPHPRGRRCLFLDWGEIGALRLLVGVDDRSERGDPLVAAEPHHDHALRRAPEALHVLDGHPDHGAAGRD